MRRLASFVIVVSMLFSSNALAVQGLVEDISKQGTHLPSEYVFKTEINQELMPVKLVNGSAKPGIYHLPKGTTLTSLIALSGGKRADSISSEIVIKRDSGSVEFDMDKFLTDEKIKDLELKSGDIISIKEDEPFIDRDTLNIVSVASSIMSIVLAAAIISNNNN